MSNAGGSNLSRQSSSQQSSRSILSKQVFSSRELEEIKQSTVNVVGKQVLQWTPVVIGTEFPRLVNNMKVKYIGGDFLNKQDFPKKLESI